jgi:hypothetical protein
MEKNKQLKKMSKLPKKTKIITSIILITELLFMFRGNKLYGLVLFMITISVMLIIFDKDENNIENIENEKMKTVRNSIIKEIELIKKSTKKLNYKLSSANKLEDIIKYLDVVSERYSFIKKNYGENRGMDTLIKLIEQLEDLEGNLKKINDKILNFYVLKNDDNHLNEDLDHIIAQLDAQKTLSEN